MPLSQTLPALRKGQRISIVLAGQEKLFDQGRLLRVSPDGLTIEAQVEALPGEPPQNFRFLPEKGQWRWFEPTSYGDWTPGIAIEPEKEIRYLIEGFN